MPYLKQNADAWRLPIFCHNSILRNVQEGIWQ